MSDEPASGRRRDRRGRGRRGPDLRPGPLAPHGVPAARSRAERFDTLALAVLQEVEQRWPGDLDRVDLAVEEVPVVPATWLGQDVPLGSLVPVPGGPGEGVRARLVLFRRPIEHLGRERPELTSTLLMVVCDQLSVMLGVRPEEVHPGYPPHH